MGVVRCFCLLIKSRRDDVVAASSCLLFPKSRCCPRRCHGSVAMDANTLVCILPFLVFTFFFFFFPPHLTPPGCSAASFIALGSLPLVFCFLLTLLSASPSHLLRNVSVFHAVSAFGAAIVVRRWAEGR